MSLDTLPQKHIKISNISGLFWSLCCFLEKSLTSLSMRSLWCAAIGLAAHKEFPIPQAWRSISIVWAFLVRLFEGGDLAKMTLNVFLAWHFLKSNCSNCQRDDLLFRPRIKVIHWQLLLKQDSQSLTMSWKIVLTTWARHGPTALLLLKCIKQCCVLVIMCWAKCL